MSSIFNLKNLPPTAKKSLLTGLFFATVIALPLFVWTALNVNFNLNKRAQGEPNSCGGTCGSNYNCQANLYCYQGFCRNPICADKTNCICDAVTQTPTSIPTSSANPVNVSTKTTTPSPTSIATSSASPKGGNETFGGLEFETPEPVKLDNQADQSVKPTNNLFFAEYALYIFGALILVILVSIYLATRWLKKSNTPHILPPTNI